LSSGGMARGIVRYIVVPEDAGLPYLAPLCNS
jgi:hypothetical protein